MKKILLVIGLLFIPVTCFAQMTTMVENHVTGSRTVNGILVKDIETRHTYGIAAEIFTDYVTVTTNAVFNESGSTTSGMGTMTPGMFDTSDVLDGATLVFKVGTITRGAATLTATVCQFVGTSSYYGTQTYQFGTTTTIIPLDAYSEYTSVSIKPDTGSITVSVFYNGVTRKIP